MKNKSAQKIVKPESGESKQLFLIALAAFLVHIPILFSEFTWDDAILFLDTGVYFCTNPAEPIFFSSYYFNPNYYRPILTYLFHLESCVFKFSPFGYKLINLIFFTITSVFLVDFLKNWVLRSGTKVNQSLLYFVSCFWIFHPIQTELINQVTNRFDLVLILLTLLVLRNIENKNIGSLIFTFFLTVFACLTKETAVIIPALILCMGFINTSYKDFKSGLYRHFIAAISAVLFVFLLRYLFLGYVFKSIPTGIVSGVVSHIALISRTAIYSIRLLFLAKFNAPIHWSENPIQMTGVIPYIEIFVFTALILLTAYLFFKQKKIGWILFAFWVTLLPVIQIFPIQLSGNSILAERYLSLPLVLLLLYLVNLLAPVYESMNLSRLKWAAIGLVCVEVFLSFYMQYQWRKAESLWQFASLRAQNSRVPYINLASIAMGRGQYDLGIEYSAKAILIGPPTSHRDSIDMGIALFNRANSYMKKGRFAEAEADYLLAIETADANNVSNYTYSTNLSICLLVQERREEARTLLRELKIKYPNNLRVEELTRYILTHEEETIREFRP